MLLKTHFNNNHTTKSKSENISKHWQHMETLANAVTGGGKFGCADAEALKTQTEKFGNKDVFISLIISYISVVYVDHFNR